MGGPLTSFAKKLWLGYAGGCSFRLESTDLGLYSHFYITVFKSSVQQVCKLSERSSVWTELFCSVPKFPR